MAVPTKNESAKVTAKVLIENVVNHYGIPAKIHSDQGKSFECNLIKEMCELLNIKKTKTSPYHPMGNSQFECFNRSLLNLLRTLDIEQKGRWKDHVASLVHAYNCTKNDSTGYAPFFLMFGRNPRLPVDLAFGLCKDGKEVAYSEYVGELKERLENAYGRARRQVEHLQSMSKGRYDNKVRGASLSEGDRVLVRKMYFVQGRHKIDNKWEEEIHVVIRQPNDEIPVYEIGREDKRGRTRKLHRNLLLPINNIGQEWGKDKPVVKPPPRVKLRSEAKENVKESDNDTGSESESDSDMPARRMQTGVRNEGDVNENVVENVVENDGENDGNGVENVENNGDADVVQNAEAQQRQPAVENVEAVQPGGDVQSSGRPVRDRRPPQWYTSGDYVTSSLLTEYYV